jgi:hypothetical protein
LNKPTNVVLFSFDKYQKAMLEEKDRHDGLVEVMRNKHRESIDSLNSRFNATLELKAELEARVKDLTSQVERLDPVRITTTAAVYIHHSHAWHIYICV